MNIYLLFLIITVLLIVIYIVWRKRTKISSRSFAKIQQSWNQIIELSRSDQKHAVLEADKLLNYCLMLKGISGSVGEQLKKSASLFSNLNGVWLAHKLRNRIAHELNFQPSLAETNKALNEFKKAINNLNIKI